MTKIFVSYRRDDSADVAGRIYDRLAAKFGKEAIFKDVDSIPFGVNFKEYLENAVRQCAVELVIIGRQWLDIADEHGQRRLDNPRDFVRIEIESALNRSIPVIPLLVSGASMPPEDRLPPSLAGLVYRNGTEVRRDPDFHHDMNRVIASLEQWLKAEPTELAAEPEWLRVEPTEPTLPEWLKVDPPEPDEPEWLKAESTEPTLPEWLKADPPETDEPPVKGVPWPSSMILSPTPEQQARLDVMLDTKRPPQERAEAGRKLAELGDPRPGVCDLNIQWCDVPEGEFFGMNRLKLGLPAFRISKYLITYAQYKTFVDAPDGYGNTVWWKGLAKRENMPGTQNCRYANHPADSVSWYDAVAFCRWLSARLGYTITLPTEKQWEKAARGATRQDYPYGNMFDAAKGNTKETGIGQPSAVGIFPDGASPYGALDMSGNVSEWTLTEYERRRSDDLTNRNRRVLRGGTFSGDARSAACGSRGTLGPADRNGSSGFRVVCGAAPA